MELQRRGIISDWRAAQGIASQLLYQTVVYFTFKCFMWELGDKCFAGEEKGRDT